MTARWHLWRSWWFRVAALVVIFYGIGYAFAVWYVFPIDIREVASTGEVTFTPRDGAQWIHGEIASAVWLRGGLFVRHMVFTQGAFFVFTVSGRVFVLAPPELGDSPACLDTFWWTGDPRAFPFPSKNYGQG